MARLYHPTASEGRQEHLLKKFLEDDDKHPTNGEGIFGLIRHDDKG